MKDKVDKERYKKVEKKNEPMLFEKITCPFCNSNVVMILDHKKINDNVSEWICLFCGQVFEFYINETQ
ncbi:MAG: hypothetical protein N2249_00015 [Melioribacter sp.]|nr:hypothetical protein [Melioribacter sp.]